MSKAPGMGSLWTKIKGIKDFREKYIEHIMSHIEESLIIKEKGLKSDNDNLKIGAANFYTSEYSKLAKEFKNTKSKDLVSETDYEKYRKRMEREKKEKAAGVTPFLTTTYTGTES